MATPHVTGAAATGASGSTLKQATMDSTIPSSSLDGKCVTGSRLDVSTFY